MRLDILYRVSSSFSAHGCPVDNLGLVCRLPNLSVGTIPSGWQQEMEYVCSGSHVLIPLEAQAEAHTSELSSFAGWSPSACFLVPGRIPYL